MNFGTEDQLPAADTDLPAGWRGGGFGHPDSGGLSMLGWLMMLLILLAASALRHRGPLGVSVILAEVAGIEFSCSGYTKYRLAMGPIWIQAGIRDAEPAAT